jgi:ankyrin repeat protein
LILVNQPDQDLVSEFIDAAAQNAAKARQLLSQHPELIHARWVHGESVLHFLAVENFIDGVRFLAENGADPNMVNEFGDPPLIDVAFLGNAEVAEILLANGADPNGRSRTRDNVLHCAVRSGNSRLVRMLLDAGADPTYRTDFDETVFDALPADPAHRESIIVVLAEYEIHPGAV